MAHIGPLINATSSGTARPALISSNVMGRHPLDSVPAVIVTPAHLLHAIAAPTSLPLQDSSLSSPVKTSPTICSFIPAQSFRGDLQPKKHTQHDTCMISSPQKPQLKEIIDLSHTWRDPDDRTDAAATLSSRPTPATEDSMPCIAQIFKMFSTQTGTSGAKCNQHGSRNHHESTNLAYATYNSGVDSQACHRRAIAYTVDELHLATITTAYACPSLWEDHR